MAALESNACMSAFRLVSTSALPDLRRQQPPQPYHSLKPRSRLSDRNRKRKEELTWCASCAALWPLKGKVELDGILAHVLCCVSPSRARWRGNNRRTYLPLRVKPCNGLWMRLPGLRWRCVIMLQGSENNLRPRPPGTVIWTPPDFLDSKHQIIIERNAFLLECFNDSVERQPGLLNGFPLDWRGLSRNRFPFDGGWFPDGSDPPARSPAVRYMGLAGCPGEICPIPRVQGARAGFGKFALASLDTPLVRSHPFSQFFCVLRKVHAKP